MSRFLAAACLYFAATFAAGFVLGTIRTILVAPRLGAATAVLVEVPVMLLIAWLACGWAVRRAQVPAATGQRLAMGALAFVFLISAETVLGSFLFGRPLADQLATYSRTGAEIGLAAQLIYAAFPLLRR